jgi:hypothetical protein
MASKDKSHIDEKKQPTLKFVNSRHGAKKYIVMPLSGGFLGFSWGILAGF